METQEWALVLFTILSQLAVGTFILLWIAELLVRSKVGEDEANRFSNRGFLVVLPVMALGLLASTSHVGNLLHAPYAILNLGTSWLSREILFSGIFFIGVLIFTIMQWRRIGSSVARNVIALVTAVSGLVLTYSMASVYMIQAVPVWNSANTLISFFATTFLLGSLMTGAVLVTTYNMVRKGNPDCADLQCQLLRSNMRWIILVGVVAMGVLLVVSSIQFSYLAASQAPGAGLIYDNYSLLLSIRLVLVFIGAGLLGIFMYNAASSTNKVGLMSTLAYSAFALVLIAEIVGRYLFYASYARIGL